MAICRKYCWLVRNRSLSLVKPAIVVLFVCFIILNILIYIVQKPFYPSHYLIEIQHESTFIKIFTDQPVRRNKTVKKILYWTPFFGTWEWVENSKNELTRCQYACEATRNRSELETGDAIVFHGNDLWDEFETPIPVQIPTRMPEYRHPDQVWIFFSMEPTVYMLDNKPCAPTFGSVPNGFNWTMTYRRTSTIFMPYGEYIYKHDSGSETDSSYVYPFQGKTKLAVSLISNCWDQSRRYKLIRELQKYISVDVFGTCPGSINACPKGMESSDKCMEQLLAPYKFYLALENSLCRDYITEKFWQSLQRGQIPIVAWPFDPTGIVPPGSYINVFDFKSLFDLAEHILSVAQSDSLYKKYHKWRKDYRLSYSDRHCKICRALHENRVPQTYTDMDGWIKNDYCKMISFPLFVSSAVDRFLFDLGII